MIQYSIVIELPDGEPVSLAEAKSHLEITDDSKDAMITRLIKVARRRCEAYAGLSFVTQERRITMDRFPCSSLENPYRDINVPYGPVQEDTVVISYIDDAGDTIVLDASLYAVMVGDLTRISPLNDSGDRGSWPSAKSAPNSIIIDYTAGYGSVGEGTIPDQAIQAMLLEIGSLFENRQNEVVGTSSNVVSMINTNSKALLDDIKVYWNANY